MRPLTKALGAGLILIAIFSISFYFFYQRAQKDLPKQPLILTPAVINQPLPKANLVDVSGKLLDDEKLRRGRVVLVFTLTECPPCDQENEFLKTVVGGRKDISFFYVIPFGNKDQALKTAQSKYTFETFFDEGSMLSRSLQVYQVPLKIFLEDGIIKKTWVEATVDNQRQAEFKEWLNSL
jgi:peroxiredoxin